MFNYIINSNFNFCFPEFSVFCKFQEGSLESTGGHVLDAVSSDSLNSLIKNPIFCCSVCSFIFLFIIVNNYYLLFYIIYDILFVSPSTYHNP